MRMKVSVIQSKNWIGSESRPYLGTARLITMWLLASSSLHAAPKPTPTPPVEVPARFKNAPAARPLPTDPAAPGDALSVAPWWNIFHDSTLDALERQAAASNQDLARTVARIDEARQGTRTAAASYYPTVESNLLAVRQRTTDTGPILRAQLVGNAGAFGAVLGAGSGKIPAFASRGLSATYNDFRAPLTVSYEIDVFGRIRHAYASARASAEAAEADRRAVSLGLSAEVATGYFALRTLDSEAAVLRRGLDLRRDAVRLSQERFSAGVAGASDLARAKVELDNTQADAEEIARQRAELENSLAALCGQPASTFRVTVRPLEENPLPAVPPGVPMQLLSRRPDLVEAERQLTAADERIRVSRAQFLPTFNIEGNAGFESAESDQLFESRSRALSVLGRIHIPIFEGGRNVADLRASQARREGALASYRATAITAYKEVETALSDLSRRAAQAEARQHAAEDAGQVLGLSQKRYLEGATNYFDVVDAHRSLLGAVINRVQTLNARFAATISLVRAIGGGWPDTRPARK